MGKSKTQSSGVDNVTAGRQHAVFSAGQALAAQPLAGMDPSIARAQANYGGQMAGGNLGMRALSGDAGAVSQLSNPYTQQVVDATNAQYGHEAANIQNQTAARASAAGAFGGSRGAIAQGVGLSQLGQSQASTIAQLRAQGYSQAEAQAQALASLGQNATGASAQLGQYQTQQGQLAQSHPFDTLSAANANAGVHGQTQTQSGSLLGDIAGIASTGLGIMTGLRKPGQP